MFTFYKGECILYCLWGHINDHDCVNIYSIFNFDLIDSTDHYFFDKQNMRESFNKTSMFNSVGRVQFCDYDSTSLKEYQSNKRKCLDHCNKACLVESYSMDPNILDYGSDVQNGTNVVVSWSPENYVFIRHNERMDQFWFLGNIGKCTSIAAISTARKKTISFLTFIFFHTRWAVAYLVVTFSYQRHSIPD